MNTTPTTPIQVTKPSVHRRPYQVFVSYVREDDRKTNGQLIEWVQSVFEECTKRINEPIKLWVDDRDIKAGEQFSESIGLGLQSSDIFVALLSESYPTSNWCTDELKQFIESSRQRGLNAPNLFLVDLDGKWKETLEKLAQLEDLNDLNSTHIAIWLDKPFEAHRVNAAKKIEEMLKPLPPKETKGFPIGRDSSPDSGPDWRGQEVYQYISAFDSVRSQRDKIGMPQQTAMIDLRAKLSYLLGYTIVVSETQAFDSLGAIQTLAQASKAWRQRPGPIAPFRIAYFVKPKGHVVDIALGKFTEVEQGKRVFDFSAWRKHENERDGGDNVRTTLDEARVYDADWGHFLEAARFLSWFPCEGLAYPAPVALDVYLQHLIETYSGGDSRGKASAITDNIEKVMSKTPFRGQRTALYQEADKRGWSPAEVGAVKDVIDVAYNRTVADSILFAATSNRQARSIVLTDPTPDLRAPGFDEAVQSLLGYRDVTKSESHGYERFQGAWEGRLETAPAQVLSWADVFEVTSEPEWFELRNNVLSARGTGVEAEQWQDSMLKLSEWIQRQLPGNVTVNAKAGRITLQADGFEAGVGDRPGSDLGVVGQGAAQK